METHNNRLQEPVPSEVGSGTTSTFGGFAAMKYYVVFSSIMEYHTV